MAKWREDGIIFGSTGAEAKKEATKLELEALLARALLVLKNGADEAVLSQLIADIESAINS